MSCSTYFRVPHGKKFMFHIWKENVPHVKKKSVVFHVRKHFRVPHMERKCSTCGKKNVVPRMKTFSCSTYGRNSCFHIWKKNVPHMERNSCSTYEKNVPHMKKNVVFHVRKHFRVPHVERNSCSTYGKKMFHI
ncbi:hypothetical protein CEXT_317091 [Caerostris extrusa]|uniref:Transposase n=1 Tax=Caerostris extrusa TaxID=172846 RepID=A0AAV4MFD0_CAEEX|nr:hypothetical protein CEXT_317091 [Caerostris extrusa]